MMLITISLALLLTITFFNVVLGASFTTYNPGTDFGVTVGIDSVTGAFAIIIAIISIAVIVGIQVLGSGISEQSVKAIITIIGYASVWGILSILSLNLIQSIEIFGYLIYVGLTIMYSVGVLTKLTS